MRSWKASTAAACAVRSRAIFRPPSRPPSAAELDALTPGRALVARFTAELDALAGPERLGLAVSGGPDSIAMLLLAAAARPGAIEVMSVDHGLRAESAAEVLAVAALCERLNVPHHAIHLALDRGGNVQARARAARYAAMAEVAAARGLGTLATAHHADDQAETLLMRLARGAGVSGLAGVRPVQQISGLRVVRALLGWRKAELEAICQRAGVAFVDDPSNRDPAYNRTAVRAALRNVDLDPLMLGRSAAHLAAAEDALDWATNAHADRLLIEGRAARIDVEDLPDEIARRLLLRAFALLEVDQPRGPDLERAMAALSDGRPATLSGLLLTPLGAKSWKLAPEPPRRR